MVTIKFAYSRLRKLLASQRRKIYDFFGKSVDLLHDRLIAPKIAQLKDSRAYKAIPVQKILVVGVQTARRDGSIDRIFRTMSKSRHELVLTLKGVENLGKLDNVNLLLAEHDLSIFDWVWMIDDDVELPDDFTDVFVAICTIRNYQIAGPAHRAWSYWGFEITRRHAGILTHDTNFVEIGPVTAFHKSMFEHVFPLPSLKYGWGPDILWSHNMETRGWRLGIVDAAALRHTSPIAKTYDAQTAFEECKTFLRESGHDIAKIREKRIVKKFSKLT